MTIRPGRVATHRRERLVDGWEIARAPAGSLGDPSQLADTASLQWIPAREAGTVASVLRTAGAWSLDGAAERFDACDWWYRTHFLTPQAADSEATVLGFDGLATLADVWLNGEALFSSDNMFVAHEHDVSSRLRHGRNNELVIRFRSLDAALQARRPRPAWRAPMIEHQQLRWFRTTLLGRTPGWSPPAAPVGLWKDAWLETRSSVSVSTLHVDASLVGCTGQLEVAATLAAQRGQRIKAVVLEVQRGGQSHRAPLTPREGGTFSGTLSIQDVCAWWPHTHGEPCLYDAQLAVSLSAATEPIVIELGRVGFRHIELDRTRDRFTLRINGADVFCRGACWTPLDPVSLRASPEALQAAVAQACDAGMNMLRLSGTMVYEDDAFFDACDEQGMLVWQDFMFANMDYPTETPFLASVEQEVHQQLARLRSRASLALLCGNSEVEQQAAMWGAPRDRWTPALFHDHMAAWVRDTLPAVPWWPSSAHGGAFPYQGDVGTTSYYGVGAYLRPLDDARRADPSFATECLAFANVPDASTIARMPGSESLRVTHPGWKSRTPRDLGAGWDFEDVRDHYLATLFKVDPARLRYSDHERYLELSRVVSGEMMAATFGEWRRAGSACGGALVWFLRDLWAGAGWGLVDDQGLAKTALYVARRVLQPVGVSFTDEGGNGLFVQLVNERGTAMNAKLDVAAYNESAALVAHAVQPIELDARSTRAVPAASMFDGFLDLSAAYRFGPPPAQVVVATLLDSADKLIAQAFHFPSGLMSHRDDVALSAAMTGRFDGGIEVTVNAERLAQHVRIELAGFTPEDNHFHLAPRGARTIRLHGAATGSRRGTVHALNARRSAHFEEAA
jgi:beta-mannosidase